MIEIKNLEYNPILRSLLKNYCLRMYEQEAITDDWHLYQEYTYLKDNNMLDVLFEEEDLTNSFLPPLKQFKA
ncbi:MAG: hypothetical protein K0R65_1535 [Crocinitomicaceae bacterium]|jgi:hypothetical protein|nr:hypothetical protein [Crocinitomicaceae bacterium]